MSKFHEYVGHTYKLVVVSLKFRLQWASCVVAGNHAQRVSEAQGLGNGAWEYACDHFPQLLPSAPGCALLALLLGLSTLAPEEAPPPPNPVLSLLEEYLGTSRGLLTHTAGSRCSGGGRALAMCPAPQPQPQPGIWGGG